LDLRELPRGGLFSEALRMEMNSVHKGPVSKFRSGRFQVSLWECRRGLRACVQCSRFNKLLGEGRIRASGAILMSFVT